MDDLIIISNLNDFIFCPASIYFHKLYGSEDTIMYQSKAQLDGTKAHEKIDNGTYSTRKNILIANDKLRTSFAKYLSRFGHRIQYSVFEIDNSKRIVDNIVNDLTNTFEKRFSQSDSVYIFKMSSSCEVLRYGYAKNEENDFFIIEFILRPLFSFLPANFAGQTVKTFYPNQANSATKAKDYPSLLCSFTWPNCSSIFSRMDLSLFR